jgi:NifB/MoaA-like Fe-S oxidoreductase
MNLCPDVDFAGVMKGVPRYYNEILRKEDPEMYEEMKKIRQRFMKEHEDDFTPERLMDKHICKKARLNLKPGRE